MLVKKLLYTNLQQTKQQNEVKNYHNKKKNNLEHLLLTLW